MGVWFQAASTSALMEVSGQPHAPAALTLGKEPPGTHWIRAWVTSYTLINYTEQSPFLETNCSSTGKEISPLHRVRNFIIVLTRARHLAPSLTV